MRVTVFGVGYVGLVTGTCLAETGNDVLCIDIDQQKVERLEKGIIPIFEPGLEELVQRNIREGRLNFSTDAAAGIRHGEIVFCAVGTPPDKNGEANLNYVKAVAQSFGQHIEGYKVLVNKSTVPVGTGDECRKVVTAELLKRKLSDTVTFDVVSNPEFLREGAAVNDSMKPERIVVGAESDTARKLMEKLYAPILRANISLLFTDIKSAELIKYASNAFLATKISFINEIANFCELTGADITAVARGMGSDSRIGHRFLHAGTGYGGSCFPKDIQALIHSGKKVNYQFRILEAVESVNNIQKKRLFHKLTEQMPELEGKTIAILGLTFKPKTDDMRDAPSIKIIKKLQAEGVNIRAFDPEGMENAKAYLSSTNLYFAHNAYDALEGADAALVVTEWDEFRSLNLDRAKEVMKGTLIIDGRNILDLQDMQKHGFYYIGVGRKTIF